MNARRRQLVILGIIFGYSLIVIAGVLLLITQPWSCGFREPPAQGEEIEDIIVRLGKPHYDSRSGAPMATQPAEFQVGYIDNTGRRYLLTVRDGIVVQVERFYQ